MARLQRDPVPVRKLRPGVPRALDDLVMELLARDADNRPRNAALVRDALVRLLETVSDEDATVIVPRDSTPETGLALRPASGRRARRPHQPGRAAGRALAPPLPRLDRRAVRRRRRPRRRRRGVLPDRYRRPAGALGARRHRRQAGTPPRRAPTTRGAATGRRDRRRRVRPAARRRRPGEPRAARLPHRRPPRHGVVHRLLQRPQPGAEAGRRPRVPAVGARRRSHPRRHVADRRAAGTPTST